MATANVTPNTTTELGFTFTEQDQVSKPLLKQDVGVVYFFKFLGAIHEMAKEKGGRKNPDGSAQKPMEIANVFNYADKTQYQLIVNSVLGNTLREAYPNHSYIGLTFRVSQTAIKTGRGGNKYAAYDIVKGDIKGVQTPDHVPYVAPTLVPESAAPAADAAPAAPEQSSKDVADGAMAKLTNAADKAPAQGADVVAAKGAQAAGAKPAQGARK